MSVYYDVKEHLQFTGRISGEYSGADICAGIMQGQLAALAGLVLIDRASIYQIKMTADGKEYNYEGDEITPEYKEVLTALDEAENVDLEVEYGYYRTASWSFYDHVGPFVLMEELHNPERNYDLNNVFYSAWHNADCSQDCGYLVAYGTKNGKTYNGEVPFEEVATVPSGEWIAQDTPIAASVKMNDGEADPAFIATCKAFATFCKEDDMSFDTYDDEGIYEFYLSNATIRTDEEAHCFIELVKELRRLSTNDFSLIAEFADLSQKDARMMEIEEGEGGKFIIKAAQV